MSCKVGFRFATLIIVLLTFPAALPAQDVERQTENRQISDSDLDKVLEKWFSDYVRYIVTKEESAEWKSLASREDKLMFIEQFWKRRDPTPETRKNEYREEYIRRWQYVNKTFTAGKPGWRTDRGRIYLMLGAPSSIERNPFGRDRTERPSEVWYYNSINNKNLPATVDISFVDFMGYGDYEIVTDLDRTARFNSAFGIAMNNLDAYALRRVGDDRSLENVISNVWGDESRIVHPELLSRDLFELETELSEIAKTPKLDLKPLHEVVRTEIARGDLGFSMDTGAFRAQAGQAFLPVTLAVPLTNISYRETSEKRDYEVELYARIVGDPASDTLEDALLISLPKEDAGSHADADYIYQFWFQVPPGGYRLSVTLRDVISGTVGHEQREIVVPSFESKTVTLSDIIIADQISEAPVNEIAHRNEAAPFRFADLRVVPNVKKEIPTNRTNFYVYFHIYNFALAADDNSGHLKVKYYFYKDGELFSKTPEFQITKRMTDTTAVQSSFPTVNFETGDYRLLAIITDEVSATEARGECSFRIVPSSTLPNKE
jgi:GWxTD domain-containing protein